MKCEGVRGWLRSPNSPTGVAGQWGRSPRLERKQPGQDLVVNYGFIHFADDPEQKASILKILTTRSPRLKPGLSTMLEGVLLTTSEANA